MALRNQFTNTCMFAAVLVTQCVCHGHSGVTFTAEPVKKEIQIDGDLSDWPKSKEYEVSDPYVFNGKPNTTDYTGRFRVACDFQRELLYVAVVIKDDVIVLDSPADRWSSRDACEIFLTLEHSPEQRVPLQFVYRESPIVAEADKRNIELQKSFEVERKQDGNTLTYEWRINLAALPGGKGVTKQAAVLGFDVGYIDRDEGDKVAVFNSSPGQAKHLTTRTLGDLMLFAKSDSLVSVTGNVERATLAGEEGGEVAQRRFAPVGITSVDSPRFYVQVPCDDKGRYEAKVPPGKYTASLFDTLPARMAEKETVTFDVKSDQATATVPVLKMRPLRKPSLVEPSRILLGSE